MKQSRFIHLIPKITFDDTANTLQVEDYDENILKDQITTLQPSDIEVTIPEENLYGSTLGIGEKMWLPFTIQIPPDVVTPMEVSTENQTRFFL